MVVLKGYELAKVLYYNELKKDTLITLKYEGHENVFDSYKVKIDEDGISYLVNKTTGIEIGMSILTDNLALFHIEK